MGARGARETLLNTHLDFLYFRLDDSSPTQKINMEIRQKVSNSKILRELQAECLEKSYTCRALTASGQQPAAQHGPQADTEPPTASSRPVLLASCAESCPPSHRSTLLVHHEPLLL